VSAIASDARLNNGHCPRSPLAVCKRLGSSIATFDEGMGQAAREIALTVEER
jgi:hypothetical protein